MLLKWWLLSKIQTVFSLSHKPNKGELAQVDQTRDFLTLKEKNVFGPHFEKKVYHVAFPCHELVNGASLSPALSGVGNLFV